MDGVVVWEDSPLVKAVRSGHVLVVDEADKAPLEVVCILKGLLEDGEMLLSDGRRIIGPRALAVPKPEDIQVHPAFQMIVLANRPGFPFLGNDFFREIGDVFAVSCIDNLDEYSEISLLRSYAPSVAESTLTRLTALFKDLRLMVDDGLLSYPYSTRELVNIVRHLEEFRDDSLVHTVENVFAFDNYDVGLREQVTSVFHRHGIPVGLSTTRFQVGDAATHSVAQIIEEAFQWRIPRHENVNAHDDEQAKEHLRVQRK